MFHPTRLVVALATVLGLTVALPAAADDTPFDGPYVGLQAGHAALRSHLSGPRGPGTNEADMGDGGGTVGAFAGYGFTFDGVYLGVEVEGSVHDLGWDHTQPDDRTFSIDQPDDLGISVRVGGLIGDSVLLYGRAGVTRSRLDTDYQVRSGRTFDRETTAHGVTVGGGAEIAATPNLFIRLDYALTGFGDQGVQSGGRGTIDRFDTDRSVARLGLGWRLPIAGGRGGALPELRPDRFDGFYVGAAAGHDVLHTEQSGPRNIAPATLTVDRANDGPGAGVFAGWGTTVGRAYLGAEIEAGLGGAEWKQARTNPNSDAGRQVSVRTRESLGAGLRLGWVVNDRTLLYGRGGVLRTRFETDYAVPRTGVYDDTRTETGWQIGGGAEIAVAEDVSLRLDYAWTDYDAWAIDYVAPDGSPATDRFETDQARFRIGVAIRY